MCINVKEEEGTKTF